MPKETNPRNSVDELRHAEYYDMQPVFDDLYRRSKEREPFTNLMEIILKRENILLAYRNIKSNDGSQTPGTDKVTIKTLQRLSADEVVENVRKFMVGSKHGYRPKPVRRKEIPKPNGKTRPLGIPCMWDRLIQQCIKQVLEPICEARFSDNSYGFRPNRSVEHAIAETHRLMQRSHLRYVIEFDIEGFFDNVNHAKLIKQMWAMGIRDKTLIYIIKQILKAPIKLPNGTMIHPDKGTPQGGIISPILANIVLNDLDQWVDSQWLNNPIIGNYNLPKNKAGAIIKSNAYAAMRRTRLKEIYIIRYADDFRIFCRTKEQAERAKEAITQWLESRLKLKISQEKTRIVNAAHSYTEFLGFKLKLYKRGKKWVIKSHVNDKNLKRVTTELVQQISKLPHAKDKYHATSIIRTYNAQVLGIQNYYCKATDICKDFRRVQYRILTRLKGRKGMHKRKGKYCREGRKLSPFEYARFGRSKALRFYKSSGEPIYPIGYVSPKPPISKTKRVCSYTPEGRKGLHDNLTINVDILRQLMRTPLWENSIEFSDNRLSLFSAQHGKCYVTQRVFKTAEEIHCHHKLPKHKGGSDKYENLVLVHDAVHKLLHAKKKETIERYLALLKLTERELEKVNTLREIAGYAPIVA